jgi:hypothetical protein
MLLCLQYNKYKTFLLSINAFKTEVHVKCFYEYSFYFTETLHFRKKNNREIIIAIYSNNPTKCINILWQQNEEFLNVETCRQHSYHGEI